MPSTPTNRIGQKNVQKQGQEVTQRQKLTARQIQRLDVFQASRQELEQVLWEKLSQNPWLEEVGDGELASVEELDDAPEPPADENEEWGELHEPDSGGRRSRVGLPSRSRTPAEEAVQNQNGLLEQVRSLDLSDSDFRVAEYIVTSLGEAGYFRLTFEEEADESGLVPPERVAEHAAARIADADGREVTPEEVEAVLLKLQDTLVPPGTAARTLQEALIRKLERHPDDAPLRDESLTILREHFALFSGRKYDDLMSATGLSREDLRAVYALVKRLRPYPGTATDPAQSAHMRGEGTAAPYVQPDFAVTPDREVIPHESGLPQLRASKTHDESLAQLEAEKKERKAKLDRLERALSNLNEEPEERERLENKALRVRQEYEQKKESCDELRRQRRDAWNFLQDLYQRRPTRQRVVQAVTNLQAEFFRTGPDALKRMTRQDVADEIEAMPNVASMSGETVRRISNSCYIDTRYGLFRLADLFSRGRVKIDGREDLSTQVVQRRLRKLIETEEEPLSDSKLADRLEEQGVQISRRTVAKYRKQLGFPTARLRKKI